MKLIAIIPLVIFLAGCNTTQIHTRANFQEVAIPSELTDCADRIVSVPDPKKLTNKQVANYIIKMKEVLNECRGDSSAIREYIKQLNEEIRKANNPDG